MTIISRHIVREILKYLALVMILVVCLYVAIDFFEKIDNFLERDLPLSLAIEYLLLKTPLIIAQTFPVSLFLSVIIVFGLMNKNNEILSLKSGGVSVYTLLKPVFGIGCVFAVFLFFFSEIVAPLTAARSNKIWLKDVKKKAFVASIEENIWIRGDRSIVHIKYFNPKSEIIYGVSLHFFNPSFVLTRRVDAEKGVYSSGKWNLENVMVQVLDQKTGEYRTELTNRKEEILNFVPDELGRAVKKSEEMNFTELRDYIRKIEKEGYDASGYKVDLHAKLAYPFLCILLCLAGSGVSLRMRGADKVGGGVACGIGIAFAYWTFHSFCLSLGYGEMLDPFIAAWTANFAFICFTSVMLLFAD